MGFSVLEGNIEARSVIIVKKSMQKDRCFQFSCSEFFIFSLHCFRCIYGRHFSHWSFGANVIRMCGLIIYTFLVIYL